MSLRNVLLGATMAIAVAMPAFAAETAMTGAAVTSVVIHSIDGKTYVIDDHKQSNGQQMVQAIIDNSANGP